VHISDVSNALKTQRLRQAETSGERNAYGISEALRNAVHVWTALCFCEHDAGGFDEKITNANTANDWPHVSLREQGKNWELLAAARSSIRTQPSQAKCFFRASINEWS
jgi:hypothetical protein